MRLAAPLMLSNLAYTLLGVTDTLYMGRVGVAEVGAVGFASLSVLTVLLLFRGTLQTVTTFVARAFGARDFGGARRWYGVYLFLCLSGVPMALLGGPLLSLLFDVLRPDPLVRELALTYGRIRLLEAPLNLLVIVNVGFLVGVGNARAPALLSWLTVALNALFAGILVFGFGLGIRGAAWGTVGAVVVQAALSQLAVWRLYGREYGGLGPAVPTKEELARLLRVGGPAGLTDLGEVSAFNFFQGIVSRLGPIELAASTIANQFASFGFLPAFALASATGSLLSRSLGAGNPVLARAVGWRGARLSIALMGGLALLFVAAPRALIELFTDSKKVIALGVAVLRVMALYQVFDGLAIVLGGALGGAGDTRFRLLVSLVGAWLVMVPTAWLLSARFGVTGAWLGALAYITLAAVAYLLRFWSGRWLRARL